LPKSYAGSRYSDLLVVIAGLETVHGYDADEADAELSWRQGEVGPELGVDVFSYSARRQDSEQYVVPSVCLSHERQN
jgi:hypothetical protein